MNTATADGREPSAERTLRLRYGLNETVNWQQFAAGSHRERIGARFRELDTHVVRLLIFDKGAPDPLGNWEEFAGCVQAVLNAGSVPMITFAKFGPPYDDADAVRAFAGQCAEVVAACVRQWGGEAVRLWYWCVWHHPNSEWVSAGLTFDHYRRIYEEVAQAILRRLTPFLEGRRPLLGGPAVDGFQPFWADWIWRFVNEIDNALIGFASWHQFGDWREPGAWGAPADEAIFRALLLARVSEYESRARAVARMLKGRGILNVCGELNAHAHHEARVSRLYNQGVFGAAYYASALIHLIRGGADLELWKSGTDDAGPYGLMDGAADLYPAFHAKRFCASHLRPGDRICFPEARAGRGVDVIVARGEGGRRSALLVHRQDTTADYEIAELTGGQTGYATLLKIDRETGGRVVEGRCRDTLFFAGYGVAVVTNVSESQGV
ncbi:MAG TPA: hypothetical protein VH575_27415 [Gemmataceae bacterium]|jgi:hypothetical protein